MKVFTVEGYDGSVQVPKPNALLLPHAMRNNTVTPSIGTTKESGRTIKETNSSCN